MPEILSMVSPTINSFSRLIPGFWAPTDASWGIDNRTCALRAIPGSEKSQRVEYRVTAADINPYIAGAAASLLQTFAILMYYSTLRLQKSLRLTYGQLFTQT
jgi:glutamine synthetase